MLFFSTLFVFRLLRRFRNVANQARRQKIRESIGLYGKPGSAVHEKHEKYKKHEKHGKRRKFKRAIPPLSAARKTTYILFITLTFLFFRGMWDHGLLDPIEGISAAIALNMAMSGNISVPMVDGSVYLGSNMGFWWLSALALSIFGWSEFSMRLLPVLGALGMAAAGWFIARRISGERSANYTVVFIGSSALVYVTSQLASPHSLYAFFVTASLMGAVYAFRDKRFFLLLHVSAILAFIVYGPAGLILPWLSLLIYSIVARQERFFARALFYWPGLLATVVIGGGYIAFLQVSNPHILTVMQHNQPSETFYSAFRFYFLWLRVLFFG